MKQKVIRLTEGDLHNIIGECVEKIVIESVNKRSVINRLYKVVEPFTHSKYHDSGWSGVDQMIEALKNAGYDVTVSVKDGGYRNSKGGNTLYTGDDVSYWKEFILEIPVEDKVVNGIINAHAAGTVNDPFSSYDLTCTFW